MLLISFDKRLISSIDCFSILRRRFRIERTSEDWYLGSPATGHGGSTPTPFLRWRPREFGRWRLYLGKWENELSKRIKVQVKLTAVRRRSERYGNSPKLVCIRVIRRGEFGYPSSYGLLLFSQPLSVLMLCSELFDYYAGEKYASSLLSPNSTTKKLVATECSSVREGARSHGSAIRPIKASRLSLEEVSYIVGSLGDVVWHESVRCSRGDRGGNPGRRCLGHENKQAKYNMEHDCIILSHKKTETKKAK